MAASDIKDLTAEDPATEAGKALDSLKKNLSHFLISGMEEQGLEIQFDEVVLKFKPRIPATATVELIGNENRLLGLQNYIKLALLPESREDFEGLLDDIPLEGLNAIVEAVAESVVPFPTK